MATLKLFNSGGQPGPEQNICFINAVLNLLFSVTAFREFFMKKLYKGKKAVLKQKTPICDEVSSIFNCAGAQSSAGALRYLMGSLSPNFEYIKNGEQQGAPEFMQDLLDSIEKELKDSGNIEMSNSFRKLYEGHEIIQYNFIGPNGDGECPTCHMPPDYAEKKFNIFFLSNEDSRDSSLQQMINRNLSTPSARFAKYCTSDNCKDARAKIEKPVTSTRIISDLPDIVFLMVPKFIRRGYSNDINLTNGFVSIQDVRFEITGIMDHVGRSNKNGHWLTWAKLDSRWYRCNDDNIEEVNQSATISSNNFVFVCVKNKEPSSPTAHDIGYIEDDNLTSTPTTVNPSVNMVKESPIESEKSSVGSKVICNGCGGTFRSLIQHLNRTTCKEFYDLPQMKVDAIENRREQRRKDMEVKRRNMSIDEKKIEKSANAASKRRGRARKSVEENKIEKDAAAERMRRGRSGKSDEEKKAYKEANAERQRKLRDNKDYKKTLAEKQAEYRQRILRDNKDYKKTLAEKQAEYRQRNHTKISSTVSGRKRIFIETVRDGPIFGCICCHRTLFKNSVIEIENIEKFRDNLNEAFNGLFEYAICSQTKGSQPDIENIPTTRGRYYLCTTCKNKLIPSGNQVGKRPAQSHQNNLEIFDTKDHPELKLTELESSLISKSLVFMKIFKKPKSRMAAIKDRCVCVPIDDQTIQETLNQLPRTPSEACIVPIKLKRKKEYKNVHLNEYVDVEKMHRALETLKEYGHPEYQFYEPSDFNSYAQRCKKDDPQGYKSLFEVDSEEEIESTKDEIENIEITDGLGDIEKIEKMESLENEEKESDDELEQHELKEEHYLKVDAVAKQQFQYNRNVAYSNDFPELQVKTLNDPISLAPGEGKVPVSILSDDLWDIKTHPHLDPTAENRLSMERDQHLTPLNYIDQRIRNINPTYANCHSYVFTFLSYIEQQQINKNIDFCTTKRGTKREGADGTIEYKLDDPWIVFDKISNSPKYWSVKRMELKAMLENVGPFHIFFTLSCGDKRYSENFTAFLRNHNVTYVYNAGFEECRIDGEPIENFFEKNSSVHEHIRQNILLATRNFQFRVQTFIKTVVHNKTSDMKVKYHSFRTEFQMRGAAHIHGVLFLDLKAIEECEVKKGQLSFKYLSSALETISNDVIPSAIEKQSVSAFIDKFISCSLQEPMTRDIALKLQQHVHSRACERPGTNCRFYFPQLPSLHTMLAVPTRITCDDIEKRTELHSHIKAVLGRVKRVLEDKESMERINQVHKADFEKLFELKSLAERSKRIIEDPLFRDQIAQLKSEKKSTLYATKKFGERNIENLRHFYGVYDEKAKKLAKRVPEWRETRLLELLYEADIIELLGIEEDLELHEDARVEEKNSELLRKYHELLSHSMKGFAVVLKRDIEEVWTNSFNHEWLEIWDSNLDVQIALDMYAIVTYITDYYLKDNTGTLEVLKAALKNSVDLPFKERLKHLRSTFLTHREMGECESYYRLLPSLHLVGSNIQKVFVPTGLNKSRLIKKVSDEEGKRNKNAMKINEKGQEGFYIETVNILEKYHGRPESLRWISAMQFVKRYCSIQVYKKLEEEEGEEEIEMIKDADNSIENDFIIALEPHKRDRLPRSVVCEVDGENLYMKKRKPQVIRLHKWKMETEPHQYFFAELELYHVFESIEEFNECQKSLDKCIEVYNMNIEKINYVRNKTMPFMQHVEEAMEKAEIVANIDEIENALDAEGAQDNADCGTEEIEEADGFVAHDIENIPKESPPPNSDNLFKRIEVDDDETLRMKTRSLDEDQLFVVEEIIDYCKKYRRARVDNNEIPPPLFRKIIGSAGVGKSFVINIAAQWCEKLLRADGDNIDHPYVVRAAFMGGAAANIGGQTLHSAFKLPLSSNISAMKNQKIRDNLMTLLRNLRLVIIDEFSMLKADMLYQLDFRLCELKENWSKPFGGVSVFIFGDPLQLQPIRAKFPWNEPYDEKHKNAHALSPLWNLFQPILLRTNHRQGRDLEYSNLLEKIRTGQAGEEEIEILSKQVVKRGDKRIPSTCVSVFSGNAQVNAKNAQILESIEGVEYNSEIVIRHGIKSMQNYTPYIEPAGNVRNSQLQKTFKFKISSRVLLTVNLNTNDLLTNGCLGTVVGVQLGDHEEVKEVHVAFDNPEAGREAIEKYPHLSQIYGKKVVPIMKYGQNFKIGRRNSGNESEATAYQIPLKLAAAVTCHRVQGQTIKSPTSVVVDFRGARQPAMVYVMLSRAQTLDQIVILDALYTDQVGWRPHQSALEELETSEKEALNVRNIENIELKIMSLNALSLPSNFIEISRLIESSKCDVICLQETWLGEAEDGEAYKIENYELSLNSRGRGRGIATYMSKKFIELFFINNLDCQMTKVGSEDIEIINLYRSQECRNIETFVKNLIDPDKKTIVVGDTNINYKNQNNHKFVKMMTEELGFQQLVTQPTFDRMPIVNPSLLDHVYVSSGLRENVKIEQKSVYFSDHDVIFISLLCSSNSIESSVKVMEL